VVLPAASAYEKSGTVTSATGEVQALRAALKVIGAKPDLEIFGLIAREMRIDLGVATPEAVFEEIRQTVRGYNVPLPVVAAGGAAQAIPPELPVAAAGRPDLVESARNTLFSSGTLGRYSKTLNSVEEAPGGLYR
jgi:NADH-quinone oxidoreductase subunit G